MSHQGYRRPGAAQPGPATGSNRQSPGFHSSSSSPTRSYGPPAPSYRPSRYPRAPSPPPREQDARKNQHQRSNLDARSEGGSSNLPKLVRGKHLYSAGGGGKKERKDREKQRAAGPAPREKDSSADRPQELKSSKSQEQLNPPLPWVQQRPKDFTLPAVRQFRLPFAPRKQQKPSGYEEKEETSEWLQGLGIDMGTPSFLESTSPRFTDSISDEPSSINGDIASNASSDMMSLREKVIKSLQARKKAATLPQRPEADAPTPPLLRPIPIAPRSMMANGTFQEPSNVQQQAQKTTFIAQPPYPSPEEYQHPMFGHHSLPQLPQLPQRPPFLAHPSLPMLPQPLLPPAQYLATPDQSPEFPASGAPRLFGFESGLVGDGEIMWDEDDEADAVRREETGSRKSSLSGEGGSRATSRASSRMSGRMSAAECYEGQRELDQFRLSPASTEDVIMQEVAARMDLDHGSNEGNRSVEEGEVVLGSHKVVSERMEVEQSSPLPPPPPSLPAKPAAGLGLLSRLAIPVELPQAQAQTPLVDRIAPPTAPRAMRDVSRSPEQVRNAALPPIAPRALLARLAPTDSLPSKPKEILPTVIDEDGKLFPLPRRLSNGSATTARPVDLQASSRCTDSYPPAKRSRRSPSPERLSVRASYDQRERRASLNQPQRRARSPSPPPRTQRRDSVSYTRRRARSPSYESARLPPPPVDRTRRRSPSPERGPSPPTPQRRFERFVPGKWPSAPVHDSLPHRPSLVRSGRRRSASPPARRPAPVAAPPRRPSPEVEIITPISKLSPAKKLEIQQAKVVLDDALGGGSDSGSTSGLRRVVEVSEIARPSSTMSQRSEGSQVKGRGARSGGMESDQVPRLSAQTLKFKRKQPMEVVDLTGDSDDEQGSSAPSAKASTTDLASVTVKKESDSDHSSSRRSTDRHSKPKSRLPPIHIRSDDLDRRNVRRAPSSSYCSDDHSAHHRDNFPSTLSYDSPPRPAEPQPAASLELPLAPVPILHPSPVKAGLVEDVSDAEPMEDDGPGSPALSSPSAVAEEVVEVGQVLEAEPACLASPTPVIDFIEDVGEVKSVAGAEENLEEVVEQALEVIEGGEVEQPTVKRQWKAPWFPKKVVSEVEVSKVVGGGQSKEMVEEKSAEIPTEPLPIESIA